MTSDSRILFANFICKFFLNGWQMAAIAVYILDASKIINPCYHACILLFKFVHPIVLSQDVYILSSQLMWKPGRAAQPSSLETFI